MVHQAEIVLCFFMALFSRTSVPNKGLGILLRNTLAGRVGDAERVLRTGVTLLGSLSQLGNVIFVHGKNYRNAENEGRTGQG